MAYTKPVQTGYAANLAPGEFVVKLDTSPVAPVAILLAGFVDKETGNIVVNAYARVVKADGSDYLDVNGSPLKSHFQTSMDRAGVDALGGIVNLKKLMALTVAGEDVTNGTNQLGLKWLNAPALDVLQHASIRTNIASAIDAAASNDLSAIL